MPRFRKLRASPGTDEVNIDGRSIRVPADRVVEVPIEEVEALTKVGGFTIEGEEVDVPDGLVAIAHADATSCSWGGQSFEAENGVFFVPCAAVADLQAHGFVAHPEAVESPADAPPAKAPKLRIPKGT